MGKHGVRYLVYRNLLHHSLSAIKRHRKQEKTRNMAYLHVMYKWRLEIIRERGKEGGGRGEKLEKTRAEKRKVWKQ